MPVRGADDGRFLKACRREPTDSTPVWFMRQAGRYMPEYRRLRERHSLLDLCHTPDLAAAVTLQPLRLGVDAAIIFADILLPFEPLGLELSFAAGEGPQLGAPIRSAADVDRLPPIVPEEHLGFVLEAIRLATRALPAGIPLIGFAGAPFTLASYAIEGGGGAFMREQPEAWHALLARFAEMVGVFLAAQVSAGAGAVQLFDSWAGRLTPEQYREMVLPHSRSALALAAEGGAPVIHFGTNTAPFLADFAAAGGDVVGVDWRIPLGQAWDTIGANRAVQGNLDPKALLAPATEREQQVRAVLAEAAGRPGHIFNLGHGVLPQTPVEAVQAVVEQVHAG